MVCPVCSHTSSKRYIGALSWFIAEYVFDERPISVNLLECKRCGLRYYDKRYSDFEMARLYSEYRGKRYFSVRNKCEPWYSAKLNSATLTDAAVKLNKNRVWSYLKHYKIKSALDYGGDRGQNIPDEIPERFLYDPADVQPVLGVTKVNESELENRRFDCIICMNVLEQVAHPMQFVEELVGHLNEGGLLYLQVPLEYPAISSVYNYVAAMIEKMYRGNLVAGMAIEAFSKFCKFKLSYQPPCALLTQSEHINFYTTEALALLRLPSMNIRKIEIVDTSEGLFRNSLVAIYQKKKCGSRNNKQS